MLKKDKEQFELLEHVIKGVHVHGRGSDNNRVLPRPLDQMDDAPPRTRKQPKTVRKTKRSGRSAKRTA